MEVSSWMRRSLMILATVNPEYTFDAASNIFCMIIPAIKKANKFSAVGVTPNFIKNWFKASAFPVLLPSIVASKAGRASRVIAVIMLAIVTPMRAVKVRLGYDLKK